MLEHAVKFGGLPFTRLLYHQAYTLRKYKKTKLVLSLLYPWLKDLLLVLE